MKKILVLTDLSELSEHALRFSVNLAKQAGDMEIILLNLLTPVHSDAFSASGEVTMMQGATAERFNVEMMKRQMERLEEDIQQFRQEFDKISVTVRFNEDRSDLNRYVREFEADLVVMASSDRDSFIDFLFGNATGNIVRKLHCPVITVKNEPARTIKNIILAVDIEEKDNEGIGQVAELANKLEAQVDLVYVITDGSASSSMMDSLNGLAIKYGIKNFTINTLNNTDIEDGIVKFARKNESGLIAVLSGGRGKLHQLIFGSTANEMIREAKLPVMVCKLHEK
jgi:nucleotide-binding universal stress UspA family protein